MITFTRRDALFLKSVFRHRPLGLPRRGATSPLVFHAGPRGGLRVLHRQEHIAVECTLPATPRPREVVLLPLTALALVAAPEDNPVAIEEAAGGTRIEWIELYFPRSSEVAVTAPDPIPTPPRLPSTWHDAPGTLLRVLDDVSNATDRFRVEGGSDTVVGDLGWRTDLPPGFRFPWPGGMNVASSRVLGPIRPPRAGIRVGRTGTHLVLHAGMWKVWLRLHDTLEPAADSLD